MKTNITTIKTKEIKSVSLMIELYCKGNHHDNINKHLCQNCSLLFNYAIERINNCPFIENKPFCSNCTIHCYQPQMRDEIKKVMRYSGPKLLFRKPVWAIKHLIQTKIFKPSNK